MYGRTGCTVSYIRRVGTDPDLVLKITKYKIERRSLKVAVNCGFLIAFFATSALCSLFGLVTLDLGVVQLILELFDVAVCLAGIAIGAYGLRLSMKTDFKPVEQFKTVALVFGVCFCALFVVKVVIESQQKTDVLNLFKTWPETAALTVYALLLVALIFCVCKFLSQVRKFSTDLVQLNAHTIPLLQTKSVLGKV